MGNAPSSEEENKQAEGNVQDDQGKDDEQNDQQTKTVSFAPAVDSNNQEIIEPNKKDDDDYDEEEDEDDFDDQEEATSPSSRRERPSLKDQNRTSYFDLVTGRQIFADEGTANRSVRNTSALLWGARSSNRSIRMLEAHELEAPAPRWKRNLRRLGLVHEKSSFLSSSKIDINSNHNDPSNHGDANQAAELASMRHYRIQSNAVHNDQSSLVLDNTRTASVVSEYLRWAFKNSFFDVMMASMVQFLFLSVLFATFIYAVYTQQPECFLGVTRLVKNRMSYGDAYHLSWTTLSTVGYGVIAPGLASLNEGSTRCMGLNVLMAIESFVGVLFGGVTGAIIFGKIARIQSIANVRFSHPLLIRYGLGVMEKDDREKENMGAKEDGEDTKNGKDDTKKDDDKEQDSNPDAISNGSNPDAIPGDSNHTNTTEIQWPCPVLEFRVVNELSSHVGGEIMDATVSVAACTLEKTHDPEIYATIRAKQLSEKLGNNKKKKKKKPSGGKTNDDGQDVSDPRRSMIAAAGMAGKGLLGTTKGAARTTGNLIQKIHHGLTKSVVLDPNMANAVLESEQEDQKPFNAAQVEKQVKEQIAREIVTAYQHPVAVRVDEGNHQLAPRRVYFKLEIETDNHPFFKRVWNIRHELNQRSPLLSSVARRMIEQNDGYWPSELNNYKSIREHVHFQELVVSLNGTANVSGSSVYAQKVYNYEDLNIGYSFAPILATDDLGRLVVDHRLLNDVREQPGGGGEPIQEDKETAEQSHAKITAIEIMDELDQSLSDYASSDLVMDTDTAEPLSQETK